MAADANGVIAGLVVAALGRERAAAALGQLAISPALMDEAGPMVSRAAFAMAMNVLLFAGLLERVPSGAAYVRDTVAQGGRIRFDHGALRTIAFPNGGTGALPPGEAAFARILVPLGYEVAGIYPLPRLRMTGRAYAHRDLPEAIPQFFVSELHVDQFDAAFADAAHRIFDGSRDPLSPDAVAALAAFEADGAIPFAQAAAVLPVIAGAFGCHHPPACVADYETLLAQSAEAAWIATEGNAFNHATDRVPDVDALAARLIAEGRPMKDKVEISANGRVRQTAMRADPVRRTLVDETGAPLERLVPGSFYEFISRAPDPETGGLDLGFDSGNATGIFAMTRAG